MDFSYSESVSSMYRIRDNCLRIYSCAKEIIMYQTLKIEEEELGESTHW